MSDIKDETEAVSITTTTSQSTNSVDRRKTLKNLGIGGALLTGAKWTSPVVLSVSLPAHARTTTTTTTIPPIVPTAINHRLISLVFNDPLDSGAVATISGQIFSANPADDLSGFVIDIDVSSFLSADTGTDPTSLTEMIRTQATTVVDGSFTANVNIIAITRSDSINPCFLTIYPPSIFATISGTRIIYQTIGSGELICP